MSKYYMKHTCFLILLFFTACESKVPIFEESKSDTLNVEYSDFEGVHLYRIDSQTLIKTISGDTITFTYLDSLLLEKTRSYSLIKSNNGSYDLLKYSHLGYVNSFLALDSIILLKYEFLDPSMDGDGAVILNPELGEIASYNYTWENSFLLSKFNGKAIPGELIDFLLSDSIFSPHNYYLKDYGKTQ